MCTAPHRAWLLCLVVLAGCVGLIGDGAESEQNGTTLKGFTPVEPTIYRLTRVQLGNAYVALFGEPLVAPADLPADDQLYGFTSISAASRTISPLDAEKYEKAAYEVLAEVWADAARREALIGCVPGSATDVCVRSALETLAARAWRRPVDSAEIDVLVALTETITADLGDPWEGVRYALALVLQSPNFLFRVEIGAPDPASGFLRYTSWEMASRLAFLITDAPPDDALFEAARSGELDDVSNIRAHAARLLDDPRARGALVSFFRDFMSIGRLDQLDKSAELFPMFSATLGPSMRTEIERMFLQTVFEGQGDFRQLFTTKETFVNAELAGIYGLSNVIGTDHVKVRLADDGRRGGLLTTPGFLAMNAHKTATSPTHRGRFVRVNLLCQDVPPPPPGVDTTLDVDPNAPAQTLRQRLEQHRTDPACASCHQAMDPIGFAFENFDAIGQWREMDNGLPVDASTDVDGTELEGGVEIGELMALLPEVGQCIARRFYQHANGHLDVASEKPAVKALIESFVTSNFDFKQLVIQLVTNDGFRYAKPTVSE